MKTVAVNLLVWVLTLIVAGYAYAEDESEEGATPEKSKYVDLAPSFVTNFGLSTKKMQYIKADITLRAPTQVAVDAIEANAPLIRHQIVMLLSRQTNDMMALPNSQETIRVEALRVSREVLEAETGEPQINDLLFTTFVIQR